eukprot:TRINITY_DN10120_c0_g1_i3.p1 TRINITY_DN10120_c0_g1~~TRINITY_DN10120_c0_g1_i3.p1  ORF type:complete len:124 (-),score=39.72 TRINITY_DN10120_c0_g1_i3:95-466(-)
MNSLAFEPSTDPTSAITQGLSKDYPSTSTTDPINSFNESPLALKDLRDQGEEKDDKVESARKPLISLLKAKAVSSIKARTKLNKTPAKQTAAQNSRASATAKHSEILLHKHEVKRSANNSVTV